MNSKPSKKPFRVLALDGGGVRAIIETVILSRLVQHFPSFIESIDMFTGASAGAIVVTALLNGLSPDEITEVWKQSVGKIFVEGWSKRIWSLDNAIGATYDATELKNMLQTTVGTKTIKEVHKKLMIPCFKLDAEAGEVHSTDPRVTNRWHPEYFHNFDHSENADTPVMDVVLRTTAAPSYFPVYQGFVDGGTFANNPSLAATSVAVTDGVNLSDICVLSISTGNNPQQITSSVLKDGNWGLFEWAPYIIDLLLDSTTQAIDQNCRALLKEKYFRLDPLLPKAFPLDDASEETVKALINVANSVDLSEVKDWIEKVWFAEAVCDSHEEQLPPPLPTENKGGWYKCNVM